MFLIRNFSDKKIIFHWSRFLRFDQNTQNDTPFYDKKMTWQATKQHKLYMVQQVNRYNGKTSKGKHQSQSPDHDISVYCKIMHHLLQPEQNIHTVENNMILCTKQSAAILF